MQTYPLIPSSEIDYVPGRINSETQQLQLFPRRHEPLNIPMHSVSLRPPHSDEYIELQVSHEYYAPLPMKMWVRVDALVEALEISSEESGVLRQNPHKLLKERVFDVDMQRLQSFTRSHAKGGGAVRYSHKNNPQLPYSLVVARDTHDVAIGVLCLGDELGTGAQKTVKLGHDVLSQRPFALAQVKDPSTQDLLIKETQAAEGLSDLSGVIHGQLVQREDSDDERLQLLMPAYDGTLRSFLGEQAQLSEAERIHLMRLIVETVYHCHANDVFLQDIKPSNILVKGKDQIAFTDLCAAAHVERPHKRRIFQGCFGNRLPDPIAIGEEFPSVSSKDATLALTPLYCAPEAFLALAKPNYTLPGSWLERCDLYALGATLYQLYFNEPLLPWQNERSFSVCGRKDQIDQAFKARKTSSLTKLLRRLLSDDPSERPRAHKLLRQLRRMDQIA